MKTTKMNLANVQGKLSRTEMKNIMAGDPPDDGGTCGAGCDIVCWYDTGSGTQEGICRINPNTNKCNCLGVY